MFGSTQFSEFNTRCVYVCGRCVCISTGGCMWIMWMWDMPLAASECASQAIHNRWWNLASRPALWSFPPPAAACFPRTHLCCWPRVVCICVYIWGREREAERERETEKERERERERDRVRMSLSLPTSTPPASFHSSICQTWIWKQKTFSSLSHHVHIWPQSWGQTSEVKWKGQKSATKHTKRL